MLTGLMPICTVNITYLMAAWFQHVPACVPYIDGCASISATGRHLPETLVFKLAMIPSAILVMIYWKLAGEWLCLLTGKKDTTIRAIQVLGFTGAAFLIIYVVALGYAGSEYQLQRRIGITLFFSLTLLSQLLLTRVLGKMASGTCPEIFYRGNLLLSLFLMILGLVSIPVPLYVENPDKWENILEWNFAIALFFHFILNSLFWKKSGFRISYRIGKD